MEWKSSKKLSSRHRPAPTVDSALGTLTMENKRKPLATASASPVQMEQWTPPFLDILFPARTDSHEPMIDDLLIMHPAFKRIMGDLEDLFDVERSVLNEHCILIVGESRLGKTRVLAEFIAKHLPKRTNECLLMPVVYVEVPQKPTIRSVAAQILGQYGERAGKRDSADEILDAIVELGKNCGTVVICLDDMHHFVDQRGQTSQYELTEWLKRLAIRMRVALVISGLGRTEEAVKLNEQLYLRMDRKLSLNRFDWRKDPDRKQFGDIVDGICESLRTSFEVPAAVSSAKFRWYVACTGRLGLLVKLVRRVVKLARKGKQKEIDFKLLHDAWARSTFDIESFAKAQHPFAATEITADEITIKRLLDTGAESDQHNDGGRRAANGGKGSKKKSSSAAKRAVRDALAA